MSIQVTRKTGMLGYAVKVKLFVNGQEETSLVSGETYEIDTNQDTVDLQVKQLTSKSKTIAVKNHSHMIVKTNPMVNLMFLAMVFLLFLGIFVSRTFTLLVFIPVIALLIISLNDNFRITENESINNDALAEEQ